MVYYSAIEKGSLLRRYNRLLAKYSTHRHELSLAQIADTLACTARYARSLLQEMQEEGWLIWRSRPGRGALGVLQCQMSVAALENMLGINAPATEAKSVPVKQGSYYSSDGFHYHISFYRPLQAPVPSIHTDRAGRHILQMVHAGLTRHLPEQTDPVPCLAHTIRVSEDGLSWHFMLRRGLVWHNGEPLEPAQLQTQLQRYAGGPGLPHVTDVIVQDYVLIMHLNQPDAMLLYRLASPVYALSHPENGVVGLGPFQLGSHSDAQMILTRAPGWHGEMPQASEIVYNTPLAATPSPALVRLDTPRSQLTPEPMITRESSDAFYYVTFNQRRGRLSPAQQAVIRQITRSLARALMEREETLAPLPEWLQPHTEAPAQALLPATLNITYFRSTEMKKLVDELIKSLRYRGCTVNTNPISVSHWLLPNQRWEEEDICLGFLRFDQHETFSLEERYRHSEMWTWFWGHAQWLRGVQLLDRINAGPAARHGARIRRMMRFLKTRHLVVPLCAQRYRLTTPACIKNIACYAQAWPDYSRIWTDEREEEGGTTLNNVIQGE